MRVAASSVRCVQMYACRGVCESPAKLVESPSYSVGSLVYAIGGWPTW